MHLIVKKNRKARGRDLNKRYKKDRVIRDVKLIEKIFDLILKDLNYLKKIEENKKYSSRSFFILLNNSKYKELIKNMNPEEFNEVANFALVMPDRPTFEDYKDMVITVVSEAKKRKRVTKEIFELIKRIYLNELNLLVDLVLNYNKIDLNKTKSVYKIKLRNRIKSILKNPRK